MNFRKGRLILLPSPAIFSSRLPFHLKLGTLNAARGSAVSFPSMVCGGVLTEIFSLEL